MGTHLRYDLMYGMLEGEEAPKGHPQEVMKELGITYQHATPQSLGDQWWFWNCENIPDTLPGYLEVVQLEPMECIGHGLSKENAEMILEYNS